MARADLSDEQWAVVGALLPAERGRKARPAHDNRRFLNGMLYVLRVGCPWRDMHERYGKWNSVYVRFRRWAEQGVRDALLADKRYDSDAVRERLLLHNILPVIPPKANRRDPASCDYRRYRDRNHVERLFNRLKQFRRIATRYDKTAASFLGFLCLAAVRLWLPHYLNRP